MMLYILYRIGIFLCSILPVKVSYFGSGILADSFYYFSVRDRRAVRHNLKMVMDASSEREVPASMVKSVFRNFAKYLVDFFRAKKMDKDYMNSNVEVCGSEHIEQARSAGKGVILLSGHIGNWELGAATVSMIGYPINAVVLTHGNKKINDLFTARRLMGNMKPIELGASLKSCYRALRRNELLALLGDRDFTRNGIETDFFGSKAMMPRGPATLSYRLGSPIVPVFLVREPDDTFKFNIEKPFTATPGMDEESAVRELTLKCAQSLEACIKKYPTQWFVFRNIWSDDEKKSLRPDTIL